MFEMIFLGTCSGTEPMPDMYHSAVAFKVNGLYYWFDAGENCSYTAHLMGEDLTKIKSIFISHPHRDHVGGLYGLLGTIKKLALVQNLTSVMDGKISLFTPDMVMWQNIYTLLDRTDDIDESKFKIDATPIADGIIYEDENISVAAIHNRHLEDSKIKDEHSYSFKIQIGGKTVIYSGDLRDMDDLNNIAGDGCDILIMETGHHDMKDICRFAEEHDVDNLYFTHHGRFIINNREEAEKIAAACKKKTIICKDKLKVIVD